MNTLAMEVVRIGLKVALQIDLGYTPEADGSNGGTVLLTPSCGYGKRCASGIPAMDTEGGCVIRWRPRSMVGKGGRNFGRSEDVLGRRNGDDGM